MSISIKEIFDFVKYVWPRRKTKHGLLLIFLLVFICIRLLFPITKIPSHVEFTIYALVLYLLWAFWLYNSGRLRKPSKKNIVAFSLKSLDPNTQNIITITFSKVADKLKKLNLSDSMFLKEIGVDIFDTKEEAEKFLLKCKYSLIIHGTVYGGKEDSKYKYDLKNFFFTYPLINAAKDSPEAKIIANDMNLMVAKRELIIEESNDFIDTDKVSNNLVEIILSIMAISLCRSFKYLEFSIKLIETLIPILNQKFDPNYKIPNDKSEFEVPIDFIRSGRLRFILNSCYITIAREYIDHEDWTNALKVSEKGLRTGADPIDCLSGMALASYYLDDIQSSMEYTEKINHVCTDHPAYLLNKAFFAIIQSEYSLVPSYYDRLRRKINDENLYIIIRAIDFLKKRKNERPEEKSLLFAIGILIYNFTDLDKGREILNDFIESTEDIELYKKLNITAKRILKL